MSDADGKERKLPKFLDKRLFIEIVMCTIFLTIISYIYLTCSSLSPQKDPPNDMCPIVKYDFDALCIRWNPTICNEGGGNKCIRPRNKWEIHGLWQNYKNGSYPESCCKSAKFKSELIESLEPRLNESWPNQKKGSHKHSFWRHEWEKHGTCSSVGVKEGQYGYFNRTLTLFEQLPLQEWLNKAGIIPTEDSKENAYNKTKVHEAIESQLGHKIALRCKKKKKKRSFIEELLVCYRYPEFKLFDCPQKDKECWDTVILPKIKVHNISSSD